jgi:hypothetical protein
MPSKVKTLSWEQAIALLPPEELLKLDRDMLLFGSATIEVVYEPDGEPRVVRVNPLDPQVPWP